MITSWIDESRRKTEEGKKKEERKKEKERKIYKVIVANSKKKKEILSRGKQFNSFLSRTISFPTNPFPINSDGKKVYVWRVESSP